MNPIPTRSDPAREAFSRQAPVFDALDEENALITWVRERVRQRVLALYAPGERLLEINAGTGIDAFFFAEKGLHVTATDQAPGMLEAMRHKRALRPDLDISIADVPFAQLGMFAGHDFDHVFSDFGGLNCIPDLSGVMHDIDALLRPGGTCSLVIMPRNSLWEWIELFRGNFQLALRRRHKGGATANIEGVPFTCHYHDPQAVQRHLPGYVRLELMALSALVPPPHLLPFARRHPGLVRTLERWEERSCRWPLLRRWGDHYLLVLRRPHR
ncbi:MAG: class I SAM-dependent methyltransferase [Flavobacteriales bacterium]|nr:class I SAM-dependent methyltransferase [Flavobacteriales bacterium]